MKTCPKLIHTAKDRVKALSHTKDLTDLNSPEEHTYKLFHYYDEKPLDVYVKTNINPVAFELLLARIQFEAAEIDDHYALGQEEIAETILRDLYGVNLIDEAQVVDQEFDMYYVWEKWCGLYSEVMELNIFDNDQLRAELEKILPVGV
ncbi:hypothetical protein [Cytobacillus gottheilii]|uniref:hypothetical protein n=1 Tax=Cytobacillus gottheilii TaxID=859144 RepID=UPI0009B938E9|nr:hypothetical protein [Cytobacillus gottheilii]